ncbi:MAG: metal-dependent transcriptional regulator [Verrucomicrobiae bacterium]|nr:metal-dependent transcriptional regulator [Verrucomicrobiae bacterium]MDW8343955.1 metal-dependent transcriptional regulator [Verrucomicrobiae bacterium]
MEVWKEFEANELTHSAAHHLLAIHELGAQYGGWARVSDIARRLAITRGSVSINLRGLKKRGLVESDEHHMVRLSREGEQYVAALIAKKTALRRFLHEVLGVSEMQAEIDSCKIEHLVSEETLNRLTEFLANWNQREASSRR